MDCGNVKFETPAKCDFSSGTQTNRQLKSYPIYLINKPIFSMKADYCEQNFILVKV